MGTKFDILARGLSESVSSRIWDEICSLVSGDEAVFDRFSPESEVFAVNKALKAGTTVRLSEELEQALVQCALYRELTGGLFDITRRDFSAIKLEEHCLSSADTGTELDFGGFAKGWTLGRIVGLLRKEGVVSAFLDFGMSSIYAMGQHPAGAPWQVELHSPYDGRLLEVFSLQDRALSISGNSPSYSAHIVNPRSGEPVTGRRLCSVQCADPLEAEVLSTAAMVCGGKLEIEDTVIKSYEI
ncbi:MAG: FAD:protein FMN transferase [Candidatus Cryptobacteroides sp.]